MAVASTVSKWRLFAQSERQPTDWLFLVNSKGPTGRVAGRKRLIRRFVDDVPCLARLDDFWRSDGRRRVALTLLRAIQAPPVDCLLIADEKSGLHQQRQQKLRPTLAQTPESSRLWQRQYKPWHLDILVPNTRHVTGHRPVRRFPAIDSQDTAGRCGRRCGVHFVSLVSEAPWSRRSTSSRSSDTP